MFFPLHWTLFQIQFLFLIYGGNQFEKFRIPFLLPDRGGIICQSNRFLFKINRIHLKKNSPPHPQRGTSKESEIDFFLILKECRLLRQNLNRFGVTDFLNNRQGGVSFFVRMVDVRARRRKKSIYLKSFLIFL